MRERRERFPLIALGLVLGYAIATLSNLVTRDVLLPGIGYGVWLGTTTLVLVALSYLLLRGHYAALLARTALGLIGLLFVLAPFLAVIGGLFVAKVPGLSFLAWPDPPDQFSRIADLLSIFGLGLAMVALHHDRAVKSPS